MKKLVMFSLVALTIFALSCNKNKKASETLEGDWEEVSINGSTVAEEDKGTVHFEFCKMKKDEWCTMSYTNSDGYNAGDYDYRIEDKGEVMIQRIQDSTKGAVEIQGKILDLTETDLTLEMNLFGFITTTVYKKK